MSQSSSYCWLLVYPVDKHLMALPPAVCRLSSMPTLVLPAAGWSVWVHNILVREKDAEMKEDEHHLELGSLLKRKVESSCFSSLHICLET